MKKFLKVLFNTVFLVALVWLTAHYCLEGHDINEIIDSMQNANPIWLIVAVVFVFIFICGESVIMKYLYEILGTKIKLFRCIK